MKVTLPGTRCDVQARVRPCSTLLTRTRHCQGIHNVYAHPDCTHCNMHAQEELSLAHARWHSNMTHCVVACLTGACGARVTLYDATVTSKLVLPVASRSKGLNVLRNKARNTQLCITEKVVVIINRARGMKNGDPNRVENARCQDICAFAVRKAT